MYYKETGMTEARVTRKGQITIPTDLRLKYNIKEGDRVQVIEEEGKIVIKIATNFYDLAGSGTGEATVEELNKLDEMREDNTNPANMT
jgi:AbrB family looped-hinge helix DNA binding protein